MRHLIRWAAGADSEAILNIYGPYIRDTAITFETVVPTVEEFADRIEVIRTQYPYLVYWVGDRLAGYVYASRHKERAAYCYDVDVSVYVSPDFHGSGIAHQLYVRLFEVIKELGYVNAYAGITVPNEKSERFHKKHGFTAIGVFHKTGYKLNQWHDVMWLEKNVREHCEEPGTIKSISELPDAYLRDILKV